MLYFKFVGYIELGGVANTLEGRIKKQDQVKM